MIASPCPPLFDPEARSEDDYLEPLMRNFVGWYRHAAQENMGMIAELLRTLGEVLPGFDSINLTESGENSRALKVIFRGPNNDRHTVRYGFSQFSDGQRALVALYCLIFLAADRDTHTSLFLDEPDNYLAPREVQPWLAAVAEQCGNTLEQVIVVSHHPVTIDYMAREHQCHRRAQRGGRRCANGTTALVRLNHVPRAESRSVGWGTRIRT